MTHRAPMLAIATLALAGCADPGPVAPPATAAAPLSAVAAAKASGVIDNARFELPFTIDGALCGLPADVSGTVVFHAVNRATQSATGQWHVGFNWNAHGTATGADGSRYRVSYAANGKVVDAVGPISPATLPVVLELVDHFFLIGQGRAPDLKVYLHGRFSFDGVAITPIDAVIRGGNGTVACDPI